nr:uncharacterized protein LOC127304436 [Lolium perenne]
MAAGDKQPAKSTRVRGPDLERNVGGHASASGGDNPSRAGQIRRRGRDLGAEIDRDGANAPAPSMELPIYNTPNKNMLAAQAAAEELRGLEGEELRRQTMRVTELLKAANRQSKDPRGMVPFSRDDPPPVKFARQSVEDGDLALKPEEEEQGVDVPTSSAPLRVVPISVRPPAASSSAPKGRKWTTAQLEAVLKKQRRMGPKPVPEAAGAAIKFTKGAGSGPAPGVVSPPPLQRQRREPTPQPPPRVRTPPAIPPPAAGAGSSSSAALPSAPGSGSQGEPAHRTGQPSIGDLFPRCRPEGPAAGAGGAAPEVVVLDASLKGAPLPPESSAPTGQSGLAVPPPASEPTREEPARPADADARALVKAKGPAQAPQAPPQPLVSLHVSPAASLLNVVFAPDSSLGSVGTMEKEWRDADVHEVTSRGRSKGMASMEMFFSDFRAFAKASAAEADNRLKRVEQVNKSVVYKRTELYNRLVASYHKAKVERADMARELEVAQAAAARIPQLEEDLRAARAQCAESEKAVKVDDLSRRLDEVGGQCRKLREEVTSKSEELTATAKRWVEEISALDRGLVAAFPEAQQAALDAAGKAREARRQATGETSSPHFSMDDYLASMAARVEPITMLGYELRQWLENAPDRLLDWKESAARAGANMALSFVVSWYDEVDLNQLENRRASVEDLLRAETKTRRLAWACAIADFINKGIFVEDPNPPEEEEEAEDEDVADAEDAPEADPM